MAATREIDAVSVHGTDNHYAFVAQDGGIWGVGHRVQGRGSNDVKLRKIPKPAECKDYKKIACGKSQRWILTKTGQLFANG